MELTDIVNMAQQKSKEIVDAGQEHLPVAIIDNGEELAIVGFDVPKAVIRPALEKTLLELGAKRYVFIEEAWITKSLRPLRENIEITDLPLDDRNEAIFIFSVERGKKPRGYMAHIANVPSGRSLRGFEEFEGSIIDGLVVGNW